MGAFSALVRQLWARFPAVRHSRIPLDAPAGANYIMFNYRPMDYDIYSTADYAVNDPRSNLYRPIAGTVRLAPDDAMLSQNLNHGGAFPLEVAWQDADQSAGPFLSLLPSVDRFTPPEFFVLPGTPYDTCFRDGGCSIALLDRIYDASEPIRVIYLQVTPNVVNQEPVALKAADDPRSPVMSVGMALAEATSTETYSVSVYLPIVTRRVPEWTGVPRPAGVFEPSSGRMVGYLP